MTSNFVGALARLCLVAVVATPWLSVVRAQPSPQVQQRISAAIKAAANATSEVDFTQFVNVFIGTDNFGDVWSVVSMFVMIRLLTFVSMTVLVLQCRLAW